MATRFYLKKNKILSACVRDSSCNRPERLQHRFFPVNIPKVLGAAFFRIISMVAFELSFSIRKEFKKKRS